MTHGPHWPGALGAMTLPNGGWISRGRPHPVAELELTADNALTPACYETGPRGLVCTQPKGQQHDWHIACGWGGVLAVWPNGERA